jgi:putative membrane protein
MRKTPLVVLVAAPLLLTAAASFAAEVSAGDRRFVEEAAAGGQAEVSDGQLAQEKGASNEVKQFGSKMVSDHSQANSELMQIAQSKGITPPSHPTRSEMRAEKQLDRLSGSAFDRQYAKEQVADHQKTIALFQKEANSGTDPDLKAFANKLLPKLQQHLQMAESLGKG